MLSGKDSCLSCAEGSRDGGFNFRFISMNDLNMINFHIKLPATELFF